MGRHTRGGARGGRGGNRGGHSNGNGDGGNNNNSGSNTGNGNGNGQQANNQNNNQGNNQNYQNTSRNPRNVNTNNTNINNKNQNFNNTNRNFNNTNQSFNNAGQNFNNNSNQNTNRPPKRNRDDGNNVAATDNNPRKRHAPDPVRTKFTQRDIQNTLNEARRLVREYKKAEKMVNSLMPRDNRTLWRFMNIQKEGMNAVKMCYYLHHTIIDPEGDYKMEVTDAKACDCNNVDPGGKGIPECYLLALFYLVCATNYESGLFNFRTPVETKLRPEDGQVLNGQLYIRPVETTGEEAPPTWLDR